MRYGIGCLAAVCFFASGAHASAVFVYDNDLNGVVAPAVGASPFGSYLSTGWIFGEMSADPGWVGQQMWFDAVRLQNPTSNPINVGLMIGVWAADGPGGTPGTELDINYTSTLSYLPSYNYLGVYVNWPIPAGNFWMGYALETYGASTTAQELNSLRFYLGDAPTVGTSTQFALLGNQTGFLGNNPTIAGPAASYLSQSIQIQVPDAPEPSSGMLAIAGILLLAGLTGRNRWRAARQDA